MTDADDLRRMLNERRTGHTPDWTVPRHLRARGVVYSIAPEQLDEITRWMSGMGASTVRIRKTDEATCFGVQTETSGEWWLGEQGAPRLLADVADGWFGATIEVGVPELILASRQVATIARIIREQDAYYAEIDIPQGGLVRFNMDGESGDAQQFELDADCQVRSFF